MARKFSPGLSVQLMPTLIHRNYVALAGMQNDVYALGAGLRQKLTKRLALTADYFYVLPGYVADHYRNALGLGFDIETGGHVFQLHVTNAQGMTEKVFRTPNHRQLFQRRHLLRLHRGPEFHGEIAAEMR